MPIMIASCTKGSLQDAMYSNRINMGVTNTLNNVNNDHHSPSLKSIIVVTSFDRYISKVSWG